MAIYILRRLVLMMPTLIGMTLLLFVIVRFTPGLTGGSAFESGTANAKLDREAAHKARLKALGMLDDNGNEIPIYMQYFKWLGNACRGNFGESVANRVPVSQLIKDALPVTLTMNAIEGVLVWFIAIPMGMLAAAKRGKALDTFWGLFTIALYSLPLIWIGAMSIGIFANPKNLNWFPIGGLHSTNAQSLGSWDYAMDYLWHLVLPIAVMSIGGFAYLTKQMRASMLDNLNLDYARTARAKGVGERRVIFHHVFRNSLLPIITIFAGVLPGLLGGSVIIEYIFSIPGMGKLAYDAAYGHDLPTLQAIAFIGGVVSLVSLLLADICYAIADPRVSYD